jgi:hypothetical protein
MLYRQSAALSNLASSTKVASPVTRERALRELLFSVLNPFLSESVSMMAAEPGPNRMNMKFTNGGRTVVIHLVRGLPPKLSRDKKTITITFAERAAIRSKLHKG